MSSWSEILLHHINSELTRYSGCVILRDPDRLVTDDVVNRLTELGWTVQTLQEDAIAVREQYEQHWRFYFPVLPKKVIFHSTTVALQYDITHDNPIIKLALSELFPNLDSRVLSDLRDSWYAILYQAQTLEATHSLDAWQTTRFVLEQVLQVRLADTLSWEDYLYLLGTILTRQVELPSAIKDILRQQFQEHLGHFAISLDLASTQRFLEHVWQAYGAHYLSDDNEIKETLPADISTATHFLDSDPNIQDIFTRLRIQGVLSPWRLDDPQIIHKDWIQPNIHYIIDNEAFLLKELHFAEDQLPTDTSDIDAWMMFARRWASIRLGYYASKRISDQLSHRFSSLHLAIQQNFEAWLTKNYLSLIQHPYLPHPTMVHHLLPYLASRYHPQPNSGIALLVIDGMSMEDWLVIREQWQGRMSDWKITEKALFAFLPTLTAISRQALLSGKMPIAFEKTIFRTDRENSHFRHFWNARGIPSDQIAFLSNLKSDGNSWEQFQGMLERPYLSVGAFVTNIVDNLIHQVHDPSGFQAQLRIQESRHHFIYRMISLLLERFESVVVISDHGHIEGIGIGDIPYGRVASEKALRTRIFTQATEQSFWDNKKIIHWPNWGLPKNWTVIMPADFGLFIRERTHALGHGGLSLEECIIPLTIISRRH